MSNLLDVIRKNIEFVGISLLLMIIVFVIARASEVLLKKETELNSLQRIRKLIKQLLWLCCQQ